MTEPESIDRLTPDHTGRWAVRTRRTLHIFDLDNGDYVRLPGTNPNAFSYDGHVLRLTRVDRWPAVDDVFWIWFDDEGDPTLERWHKSSVIHSITRLALTDVSIRERG